MQTAIEKVENLLETLPYIREFREKIIVIKYGGAAMIQPELKSSFARDIVLLRYVGAYPVVVHGGGPEINNILKALDIKSEFIQGHRVTDAPTMEAVEMVLSGKLNKQITSLISSHGGSSVGISGRDGNLATAEIHKAEVEDKEGNLQLMDLGLVGRITEVRPELVKSLISQGFIPVISPVAENKSGHALNINADTMAGALASALKAEKLILLTDTEGVIIDGKLRDSLTEHEVKHMIQSGKISGGMIPKSNCCLDALRGGTKKAHIIDGRKPHSILLELFTDQGIGTMITL